MVQLCSNLNDLNLDHGFGCRRGTGVGRGGVGKLYGAGLQSEGMLPGVGVQSWWRLRRDEGREGRLPENEEGGESRLYGADCGEGRLRGVEGSKDTLPGSEERGEGRLPEGWRHEGGSPEEVGDDEHTLVGDPGGEVRILGSEA